MPRTSRFCPPGGNVPGGGSWTLPRKEQRDHLGPAIPVGHFPEKPELAAGGTILAETWCSESCPACMGRFREGAKEQIARRKVVSLKGFIGAV